MALCKTTTPFYLHLIKIKRQVFTEPNFLWGQMGIAQMEFNVQKVRNTGILR